MIRLKKLLKEQNNKSTYYLIMDIIGEFIELHDDFMVRYTRIEEVLHELKPKLDDRTELTQMDFPDNGGVSRDDEDEDNRIYRV